jgi:hypothetical protein
MYQNRLCLSVLTGYLIYGSFKIAVVRNEKLLTDFFPDKKSKDFSYLQKFLCKIVEKLDC